MQDAPFRYEKAIATHCRGLRDEAEANLTLPVAHCPGWTVADLVAHMIEVHWFWRTIADERLSQPPDEARRPPRPAPERLLDVFAEGAGRLVETLSAADPSTAVWTWAPSRHDIGFIARHQVQEAAVHHFDAAHAAGGTVVIADDVASDSVEEFLTFSVSSTDDPADPLPPALNGSFALRTPANGPSFTVSDGPVPGTVSWRRGADADVPAVTGTAAELLLFLYGRVELDTGMLPEGMVERFRALSFTT